MARNRVKFLGGSVLVLCGFVIFSQISVIDLVQQLNVPVELHQDLEAIIPVDVPLPTQQDKVVEWDHVALHGQKVTVKSLYLREEEDQHECVNRPFERTKFTLIISVYKSIDPWFFSHHQRFMRENKKFIERVIFSWNSPPDDHENVLESLKEIGVVIELFLHPENSILNRFSIGNFACTEKILMMDDDVYADPTIVRGAWRLARNPVTDGRLIGIYCSGFSSEEDEQGIERPVDYKTWGINYVCGESCRLILTPFLFISKSLHVAYFSPEYADLREQALLLDSDDLMANYVASNELYKKQKQKVSGPVSIVNKKGKRKTKFFRTIGSAIHYCFKCMASAPFWDNNLSQSAPKPPKGTGKEEGKKEKRLSRKKNHIRDRNTFIRFAGIDLNLGLPLGSEEYCSY